MTEKLQSALLKFYYYDYWAGWRCTGKRCEALRDSRFCLLVSHSPSCEIAEAEQILINHDSYRAEEAPADPWLIDPELEKSHAHSYETTKHATGGAEAGE